MFTRLICCLVTLLFTTATMAAPTEKPIIFWGSDPVAPGEAVLLVGHAFGTAPRVELARLNDTPGEAQPVRWPGKGVTLAPVQPTEQSLKFVLPSTLAPGVYLCRVVGPGGASEPFRLNAPTIYWAQGNAGTAANPGGQVRVFGRCVGVTGKAPLLRLRPASGGQAMSLPGKADNAWSARFPLPKTLAPGTYRMAVHNGTGGAGGWTDGNTLTVAAAQPWPARVFNVKEMGAVGTGAQDDTAAIQTALQKAGEAGGGVVYFPRGRYQLTDTLTVPRFTVLRGEKRELVSLFWPDSSTPFPALVRGSNSFGMEELTLYCSNYVHGIVSDQGKPDAGDVFLRRLRMRAVMFRGHLKPEEVDSRFRLFLKQSTGGGDTIRLGGRNIEVTGCDLYGSGRAFYLLGVQGGRVSGNTFYNGRWGWYTITGPDGLIFEDNRILGADLMSTGGGINCLGSVAYAQNVYYAGNTLRLMHGWDREAMTSDAGFGMYYGKAADADQTGFRMVEKPARPIEAINNWKGAGVFILGGRGMGQVRQVASVEGDRVRLDRPWQVAPDDTSIITITMMQQQYIFHGNTFEDAGVALQYYGTSINHIAQGNKSERTGGFYNSGRWYRHYQPSWYCQFLDNEILEGNIYRGGANNATLSGEAFLGTHGLQRGDNPAPLALAGIHRRNHLRSNARIQLLGVSESAPGLRDVVVENNTVENSQVGIEVDGGCLGVLQRGNRFVNVVRPLADKREERRLILERAAKLAGKKEPVARWSFDQVTTLTAPDSSGNTFHAAIEGQAPVVEGVSGQAVRFDGKSRLKIPGANVLGFKEYSIGGWIKPASVTGRYGLVVKRTGGTGPYVICLMNGSIALDATNMDGKWSFNCTSKPLITPNAWHHFLVVMREGEGVRIYVDGQEAGRKDVPDKIGQNEDPIFLGWDYWGGPRRSTNEPGYYEGLMDEVCVWSRALSAEEALAEFRRIKP